MARVTKEEVLKSIRGSIRTHMQWVDRAKALVNGLEVTKEQIPLEVTNCEFGKWFYCDGQILRSMFKEEAIKKLESKHKELHDIYMKIFKIYFDTSNFSLWEKLLNRQETISVTEEQTAIEYLSDLEQVSDELISFLNLIEKNVNTVDEKIFEKFI